MSSARHQARALATGVALMVIAGFAPALLLGLIGRGISPNIAVLIGLAVFIACLGGSGWRTGLVISLPLALFAALADWVAPVAAPNVFDATTVAVYLPGDSTLLPAHPVAVTLGDVATVLPPAVLMVTT